MESANHWSAEITPARIRVAQRGDAAEIQTLLQTAPYRHLHVDWYLPGDWLGADSFVVLTPPDGQKKAGLRRQLFGRRPALQGCLALGADPVPAAWVRVAALRDGVSRTDAFAGMLETAVPALRAVGVTELAWLAIYDWVDAILPNLGFTRAHALETYVRDPAPPPPLPPREDLQIRPVREEDFGRLAAIEAAAFAPIWRQSARALAFAESQTLTFDVVLRAGECVGYQMSSTGDSGAHLVRMTVDPQVQGQGIGTYLLIHTLQEYTRRGLTVASLNTQTDNLPSQRLYTRYGFRPTGQQLAVWTRPL